MNKYFELRKAISERFLGRQSRFQLGGVKSKRMSLIKEKGRKSNYRQSYMDPKAKSIEYLKRERLLDLERMSSFIEVSLRAQACPMPLNADTWDGMKCPYGCRYCFADYFKSSLYTSFFDNTKGMGLRSCSPDFMKSELDELMKFRHKGVSGNSELRNAIGLEIPIRIGIRFEDFTLAEKKEGISLELLKYLADISYPVMINTKSDLIAEDSYVKQLKRNKGKAAVHVTVISSDEELVKRIEPGAPSFARRLEAMKILQHEGIRVVARIEPYMFLINDNKKQLEDWADRVYKAGVRHITLDTYSYSAFSEGIRGNFCSLGYDFDRMFNIVSDSQVLGSLLLEEFMNYLRDKGFKCSAFDLGNVPHNDNIICCEVGDWFTGGFNYGCVVGAIQFIRMSQGPVTWGMFEKWVEEKGGFLSDKLKGEVKRLWMGMDTAAYSNEWAGGISLCGKDQDDSVWVYQKGNKWREELLQGVLKDIF